jgi:beta-galactosidase
VIHVAARPAAAKIDAKIALFDPVGETAAGLDRSGIRYETIAADADLSGYDVFIVGKKALSVDGLAPDISTVADGLRVVIFEQTGEVLTKRFGFRVAEYGLRQVFPRVPDHPLLDRLTTDQLRDWRGSATVLPARLSYELRPRFGPTVRWCDIPVTRLWRCGNRGNVASALIEKPARGDFLPVVDGGYDLQYSPLIEYRQGKGLVLFCQLDVTGRSETESVAETLMHHLFRYVADWQPVAQRTAVYVGEEAGKKHLASIGVAGANYEHGKLSPNQVLVVGPGGVEVLATDASAIAQWLKAGGHLLTIGLDGQRLQALLPNKIEAKRAEHIATYFDAPGRGSPLAGIGPADVHNRDPREIPLITAGAEVVGDGVLALFRDTNVVLCQLVPWRFDKPQQVNLKKTFRRSSYLLTRLLANLGVAGATPILERFSHPVDVSNSEQRWLDGLYLDQAEEWDDPYRFFRW